MIQPDLANSILQLSIKFLKKQNNVSENILIALQGFFFGVQGLGTAVDIFEISKFIKFALES